jgi:2-isopropylmalate synthase
MVADTVAFVVGHGRRVFLDCEHFFDGYAHDRDYGVRVLETAFAAGAEVGVMCDTNGGMLPMGVGRVVAEVRGRVSGKLGIHCQDDTGCAVANSLAAVEAGVTHVQGTANGYGERAGNADTFALIGNLVTKMGLPVVPAGCLAELKRVSHAIAELANIAPDDHQPFVGASAFAHKAGLHASAIKVSPELYNHLDPAVVGNDMRILVTEMAGRASIELKGRELGVELAGQADAIGRVVDQVKVLEADGWSFEAADASFELLLRAELPDAPAPLFELESYKTSVEHWGNGVVVSEATVKVHVDGERQICTAEGNGPVNALDNALRQALVGRYPQLSDVSLADYKVRILGWKGGTSATTRVLIDTTDGTQEWTTVGVHSNIVEASWHALVDAMTYAVVRRPDVTG